MRFAPPRKAHGEEDQVEFAALRKSARGAPYNGTLVLFLKLEDTPQSSLKQASRPLDPKLAILQGTVNIAVLGAGSWGTALAVLLARNGHQVSLLGRDLAELDEMRAHRENRHYLPGFPLPESIEYLELGKPIEDISFWVVAVPSPGVRECVRTIPDDRPLIILASKGLEPGTGKLLSAVAQEEKPNALVGAISGPNLANEIIRGIPTAALAACPDEAAATMVCQAFRSPTFRPYYTEDVIGVELAGALKNVLAIGAGMSDGLGYGDNTKGALLARGLREMTQLGLKMGAKIDSFFGIAGVGDLFATANSRLSRNYRVGLGLGQGRPLQEVLAEIGQVAEGVGTADCVAILAKQFQIELPIMSMVQAVIQGKLSAKDAVGMLMEREPKRESLVP